MTRSLAILLALLPVAARAEPPRQPQVRELPPPWSKGGRAGFLGPSTSTDDLAAHLRGALQMSTPQELPAGAPAPLSLSWQLGASVSLWRWAEAGATFSGRWLLQERQHQAGPVEMWLRAGPPRLGALSLQAILELASGRGGFDYAGTIWPSTTTLGAVLGLDRGRLELVISGAYQAAGEDLAQARYHGLQASAAAWLTAIRGAPWGLQVGGEVLARVGSAEGPRGPLELGAAVVGGLRLVDEHGAAVAGAYGHGWGRGMPAQWGTVRIGYSYGRGYIAERGPSLYDALQDWVGAQLRELGRPRAPALPALPPLQLPAAAPPATAGDPLWIPRVPRSTRPAYCSGLKGFSAAALSSALALQSCAAPELAGPLSPSMSPPAPSLPSAPPASPPTIAGPPRGGGTPGRAGPRGPQRVGRGTGWTDPDTRAPDPQQLPPTFWTGSRPGGPTMGAAGTPPPPPSIPIRPPPPPPLPAGVSPESVPPFLRPPAPRAAEQALRPMAPRPPEPKPPNPAPEPSPSPRRGGGAAPVRRGQEAVEAERAARVQAGEEVLGGEVTFRTRLGGRRADLVVRKPDGEVRAVEVKAGRSPIVPSQRAKDQVIESEGAMAVGKRAQRAGIAGPIRVKTEVVRRP